jgi:hypothetical protein
MSKQYFIDQSRPSWTGETCSTVYLRWREEGKFVSVYGPYSDADATERAALASVIKQLETNGDERLPSVFAD